MVNHWCMKAYSKDLRQKVVQAVERGMSKSQAARLFGISLSSVKRYSRLASHGESLTPRKRYPPQPRGPNTMLLSSMSVEGMDPSLAVEGPTNREVFDFEAYVERVLAPTLRRGQVVVRWTTLVLTKVRGLGRS